MPTYYEILEIQPTATTAEVKSAFHRLAHIYHPDKEASSNPEKYSKILKAFEILSDNEKRRQYDKQSLDPNDTQIIINIPQASAGSTSPSTALVPVSSFNLSELISISALSSDIIMSHLKRNAELALAAWKSSSIQGTLDQGAWFTLINNFRIQNDSRLMNLILETLASNKKLLKKWGRFHIASAAARDIEFFTRLVELRLADNFSGLDFFHISLAIKPKASFDAIISKNAIYLDKYNTFLRISKLKSLSETTLDLLNNDIINALPNGYEPDFPFYLMGDLEVLMVFFNHPKLNPSTYALAWVRVIVNKNNMPLAELICETEAIKEWGPVSTACLADTSAAIFSKLIQRGLMNNCDEHELAKLHAKYPEIPLEDEDLKLKLKRANILTDPNATVGMPPHEIAVILAASKFNNSTITKFLMRQNVSVAIEAIKIKNLFEKLYLYQWVEIACKKIELAPDLAVSPLFLQNITLSSKLVVALAITTLETAQSLLKSRAAKYLSGADLQLILNQYKDQIQDEILSHPEMVEKLYAHAQLNHAFDNMARGTLVPADSEHSANNDLNILYKLAVVTGSIPLFKKAILQYHHKASFEHLIKIGGVDNLKFCYQHCGNDSDLKELKNTCREKLFILTKENKYKSKQQLRQEALEKERHRLAASIQCLYFALRDTSLFTFLRTNFFEEYKNYQTIAEHAKMKPRSRTAVCFELITQIEIFTHAKKKCAPIKKIELSQPVRDILNENKSFHIILCNRYPDFMKEFSRQQSKSYVPLAPKISLFTPAQEQLIISCSLTNSDEGNPAISNLQL